MTTHPAPGALDDDGQARGHLRLLRAIERPETPTLKLSGYKTGYAAGRADERLMASAWIIASGATGVLIGASLGLIVNLKHLLLWSVR